MVKEAATLAEAGHAVTVLGPATDVALVNADAALSAEAEWAHRYVVDVRPKAGTRGTAYRVRRRAAREAKRLLGIDSPGALGYGLPALLREAEREGADLTIGHQEVGAWVCTRLARRGRRVGVDVEDWYSRHPHPSERHRHPVALLRRVEAEVLRKSAYSVTTSRSLSAALAAAYGVPPPDVVYNAFPWSDRERIDGESRDRDDRSRLSLHWVSQTIGPDRGLDLLFAALVHVDVAVDVHLRGRLPEEHAGWLRSAFPEARHRLRVHPLVPPGELLSRIAEHDVGIALESSDIESRDLTVTNKILHYFLGGLAVIASRTAGQVEVAERAPGAVTLVGQADPAAMAAAIRRLAEAPDLLASARAASLEAAARRFCWERQAPTVVSAAEAAMASSPPPSGPK